MKGLKVMGVMITAMAVLFLFAADSMAQPKQHPKLKRAAHDFLGAKFADIDVNGDGQISSTEYVNHSKAQAEERFRKLDLNSDQLITKEEIKQAGRHKMDKAKKKFKNKMEEKEAQE